MASTNTPLYRLNNRLLFDISWPNDLPTVSALHGTSWMFYLVSHVRRHLISHLERIDFTDRDPKQAYPHIIDIMDAFNPITLLKLHHLMLHYYRGLIIQNRLPFTEEWYLLLLRTISTASLWQEKDWYWRTAMEQVIFVTHRGTPTILSRFPGWTVLQTTEKHSGVPEEYLQTRFDNLTVRHNDDLLVSSKDISTSVPKISSYFTDTKRWEIICSPASLFLKAVSDPDQFFLSLYPRVEHSQFAFAMALDVIQRNFTLTDWRVNKMSTKHYWKLCHADNRGLLRLNTPQIIPTQFDPSPTDVVMNTYIKEAQSPGSCPDLFTTYPQANLERRADDRAGIFAALPPPQGEDYFQTIYLSNKLLAIDMLFDYAQDSTLTQLLTILHSGSLDPGIPPSERWTYALLHFHFKKKVDLFNQLNQQAQ